LRGFGFDEVVLMLNLDALAEVILFGRGLPE